MTTNTFVTDDDPVPQGTVFYYLNRKVLPNLGSWGLESSGEERTLVCN